MDTLRYFTAKDGPVLRIFSDAAGDIGFGAIAAGTVLVGTWQSAEAVQSKSSGWKELIPIRLMLEHISPQLGPGTLAVITTDNMGNAFCINSGKADSPELFEQLFAIIELAARFRLRLAGDWVPREHNQLSDLLSRLSPVPGHTAQETTGDNATDPPLLC